MTGPGRSPGCTWPDRLFAGRRYAVLGLGRNGLPAARTLQALGADVLAWDDGAAARAEAAGIPIGDPTADIAQFDALILSPGIPHALPTPHPAAAAAIAAGVPVLSDAELLFQAVRQSGSAARFVGITGTNGKSTTTTLITHLLRQAGRRAVAGGNLSPAALALAPLPDDGVYVLEMSSYMLERLATLRFAAAAMLNLSPDHLDRHGDMAGYAAAKRAIFDRQSTQDLAVFGLDDAHTRDMAAALASPAQRRTVSGAEVTASGADLWIEAGMLRDADGPILAMADAPCLPGAHNAQNAAAAAAIALHLGVSRADIAAGLRSFTGLPHRQQRVATLDGIDYVNDSKATNADAASRAIGCYDRIVWIAGGLAKAGGIEALAPLFPRIAHAVLIGRDAPVFAATLQEAGISHEIVPALDQAVPVACRAAHRLQASTVLLSPACASFDQFPNFEARGERFTALVHGLAHKERR